jgi:hypothetical protein
MTLIDRQDAGRPPGDILGRRANPGDKPPMWWEWHVLMAVAFGAILITARMEYRREGSLTTVFAGIYLDRTLRRIDRHEAERLSAVVDAIRSGGPVDPIPARFRQEGMSREEADVLEET